MKTFFIIFFCLFNVVLFAQPDEHYLGKNQLYIYNPLNLGSSVSTGLAIFSGAYTQTKTTNDSLGSEKKPSRHMVWSYGTVVGEKIENIRNRNFEVDVLYESDFSAGVDGWGTAIEGGTLAGNIDGINGQDNTLRFTSDATVLYHRYAKDVLAGIDVGYPIQLEIKGYVPPANTSLYQLQTWVSMTAFAHNSFFENANWITSKERTNVWRNLPPLMQGRNQSNQSTFAGTAGDVAYIKDVKITLFPNYVNGGNHFFDSSSTFKNSGTYSGQIISTGAGSVSGNNIRFRYYGGAVGFVPPQYTNFTTNELDTIRFYAKVPFNNGDVLSVNIGTQTHTFTFSSTNFELKQWLFVPTSGDLTADIKFYLNKADTVYLDDITILGSATIDSVYGISKIIQNPIEDALYRFRQTVSYTSLGGYVYWKAADWDTVYTLINAPVIEQIVSEVNAAVITWQDNSNAELRYIIQRNTDGGESWTNIDTVGVDITTYSDSTIAQATTYYYRIRCEGKYTAITPNSIAYSDDVAYITETKTYDLAFIPTALAFGTVDSTAANETASYLVADAETGDETQFTSIDDDGGNNIFNAVDSAALHGTYGYAIISGGITDDAYGIHNYSGSQDSVYVRLYIEIPTNYPNVDQGSLQSYSLIEARDATQSNFTLQLRFNSSTHYLYRLLYRTDAGLQTGTTIAQNITLNAPHYIEVLWRRGAGTGEVRVWFDGTSVFQVTGLANSAVNNLTNIRPGQNSAGALPLSGQYIFMDDVLINNSYNGGYEAVPTDTTMQVLVQNVGNQVVEIAGLDSLSSPYSVDVSGLPISLDVGEEDTLDITLNKNTIEAFYDDTLYVDKSVGTTQTYIVTATINFPELLQPTALAVTHNADTSAFSITWNDWNGEFDSVRVYSSTDNVTFTWVASVDSGVEVYEDPAGHGVLRYFKLASLRGGNVSTLTASVGYTMPQEQSDICTYPNITITNAVTTDMDDFCFWIHPNDADSSLIIDSDKGSSRIYVFDLANNLLQTINPSGMPGNIDVRYDFGLSGVGTDFVGVNNRTTGFILFYKVNPTTRQLTSCGSINAAPTLAGAEELYGFALYRSPYDTVYSAFVVDNNGTVGQWILSDSSGAIKGTYARQWEMGSISEGMVCDDETGKIYVAREDNYVREYAAEPDSSTTFQTQFANVGENGVAADLEGIAIYYYGYGTGYIALCSQGNNSFKFFTRERPHTFVKTVTVPGSVDGDGLDITNISFPSYFPYGIFGVHSGTDALIMTDYSCLQLNTSTTYWNPRIGYEPPPSDSLFTFSTPYVFTTRDSGSGTVEAVRVLTNNSGVTLHLTSLTGLASPFSVDNRTKTVNNGDTVQVRVRMNFNVNPNTYNDAIIITAEKTQQLNVSATVTSPPPPPPAGGNEDGIRDRFIDPLATGLNNGTSWTNAWTSTSSVVWGTDWDSLFISGGSTSKIYTTALSIAGNGTASQYRVITKGKSTGHNGEVIFRRTSNPAISPSGTRSYVSIENLTVDGQSVASGSLIDFSGASHHHLRFKNLNLPLHRGYVGIRVGGSTTTAHNITIQDSYFRQDSMSAEQTDMHFIQGCDTIYIIGNTYISRNNQPAPHSDGIQLNRCGDTWIEGNKFFHANNKVEFNQVCYTTENTGKIFVLNNLFYFAAPSSTAPVFAPSRVPFPGVDSAYVIQNTIVSETANGCDWIWYDGMPNVVQYNNVAVETGTKAILLFIGGSVVKSDYNQVYKPGFTTTTNWFCSSGGSRSLTSWRNVSASDEHDENTSIVQPTFANFDWNFNQWDGVYRDVYDFTIPTRLSGKSAGMPVIKLGTHTFVPDGMIGWAGE